MVSVHEKVDQIISERLRVRPDKLSPRTDLRRDLHCDELKLCEVLVEIESRFGIEIDQQRALKFRTVQDAYDFVLRYSKPHGTA